MGRRQLPARWHLLRPSEKVKSEIYLNLLPLVNATACVLLDDDRLVGVEFPPGPPIKSTS